MVEFIDPVTRLNDLIQNIELAMLTTARADGSLHSCPMATSAIEVGEILWFLSDVHTEKVEALRTDRRVNVAYADPSNNRYVSVTGICELVRDHAKLKELWRPKDKAWFTKALDDPDLILLKVHVIAAEYWSAAEARMMQLRDFGTTPAGSAVASKQHGTVNFREIEDLNR